MKRHRSNCLKLLTTALLALILPTACYNDAVTTDEVTQVDILSRFNAKGEAYLTLQIPLGGQAMTRTEFDDGTTDEYKVKDVYLLIFAGASESTATFASAYRVENPTMTVLSPFNDQVTSTVTIPINDQNLNTGDKLYVFALLNNNATAISSFSMSSVTFANGGVAKTINSSSKLSDLQAVTISNYVDGDNFYLMTNSPLASANDGTGTISTLVEVPPTFFFATQEEAMANPGGHIYVERAVAKVSVTESVSPKTVMGNTNIDFTTSDIKFALSNYNDQSYLVRHFNSTWLPYNVNDNYRFVETAPLEAGKYRTYWAEDRNYSNNTGLRSIHGWSEMGGSYYCTENTFDVSSMQDNNTTSVVVRIRVNEAKDFYTTSVTGSDVIYQLPANTVPEEGTSASSSFSRRKSSYVTSAKTIDEYLREWLMETNKDFRDWVRDYAAGEPRHVNITVQRDTRDSDGSGIVDAKVTAVTQTAQVTGSTGADAFDDLELVNYIADNITLNYYWKGYMFYRIPIRHFTDTQTPWQSTPAMTNNTTAQAYSAAAATAVGGSGADATFLGRYGMVRNNWYTININSVTHVGHPIIPPLTTDADDKVEQLLNATLRISGWEQNNSKLTN